MKISNGVSNALGTVACIMVLSVLAACDNSEMYCYKGHDEPYISPDGSHWTQRICDEWRSTFPDAHYAKPEPGAKP